MTRAALHVALALAAAGPVHLRGGDAIDAPIVGATVEGLELGGEAPRTIAWDRVRTVTGEGAEHAEPFARLADDAWRARVRLARGDVALAAPLYETLTGTYLGAGGPTARSIFEGALRLRLATGDHAGAVVALLELKRLAGGEPVVSPSIDPETGLVPELPPHFAERDASRLVGALESLSYEDEGVEGLRRAYLHAARLDAGAPTGDPPDVSALPAPLRLATLARTGDADALAALRETADEAAGDWAEAWARLALGRRAAASDDPAQRRLAVAQLLHLPVRFGDDFPYPAGLALAESARALRESGDDAGAETLLADLRRRSPGHPALPASNPNPTNGADR